MFGLIKAVNGYKEGAGSFKTYASVCIKNSVLNAVKKFAGKKNGPLNESSDIGVLDALGFFYHTPEETIVDKERGDELKLKIYAALTKNEILVLSLYLSGLTYAEIAEKLTKTEKAVDSALFRARKKIINDIETYATSVGFKSLGVIESPIQGTKSKNTEYLIYLKREN